MVRESLVKLCTCGPLITHREATLRGWGLQIGLGEQSRDCCWRTYIGVSDPERGRRVGGRSEVRMWHYPDFEISGFRILDRILVKS